GALVPACDEPPPDDGPPGEFRHFGSSLIASMTPHHRGRDTIVSPGESATLAATFAYGAIDKELEDEDVDVWIDRGCAGAWELLGTATTDDEGTVAFDAGALDTGRHRAHFVVRGDGSSTDLFVEVMPSGSHVFVSDVDGTLTTSEYVEFVKLLEGTLPDANPNASAALGALSQKGYFPIYLTARPYFLVERTREFLDDSGFPKGIVHT